MERFNVQNLFKLAEMMEWCIAQPPADPFQVADKKRVNILRANAGSFRGMYGGNEFAKSFEASLAVAQDIENDLKRFGENVNERELFHFVDEWKRHLNRECEKLFFLFIPREEADYFSGVVLFDSPAIENFPTSYNELVESAKCYALELYTASVFHSMRASEKGLHALARKLKIKLPYPVEFAEWGKIIAEIEKKLEPLQQLKRGKKKSEQLKFYSSAAAQFLYFKDAWRNHVSHSRDSYDKYQALGVFMHVKEFLEVLASKNLRESRGK